MPIQLSFLFLSSATWMATSSALMMVCISSWPEASMYVVGAVGECMTEAPICGLPILREPLVYIHSVGLCRGCHNIGCGGERSRSGVCFCIGLSVWRSFAMVGCGVMWVLVVEFSSLGCSIDHRMSQEIMLTSVVWPRM